MVSSSSSPSTSFARQIGHLSYVFITFHDALSSSVPFTMADGVTVHGTTDISRIEAPVTFKAYLICAFAAFGGIFFGYDTGWMSGVLAMPYFITQYTGLQRPDPNDPNNAAAVAAFHLTAQDQSLTTSILSAGTFFGAIIAGDVADFVGRRTTIIAGCLVFIVGCILETASTSLGLMVPGRFIAGLGVGFISAIGMPPSHGKNPS